MKRIIALLSLVALLSCTHAQYIGERQFGVSLSPSYSPQYFGVTALDASPDGNDVNGTLSNNYA